MPKPSFTTQDQVDHLSEKWHVGEDRARQMLLDVRNMLRDALIRKERVYLDDFGTFHGQVKKRTLKLIAVRYRKNDHSFSAKCQI